MQAQARRIAPFDTESVVALRLVFRRGDGGGRK